MQRIIATICATILIAFTAVGCGKDDKKAGEKGAPVDDQAAGVDKGTTPTPTPTPTPEQPAATGTPDTGATPTGAAEPVNEDDDQALEDDDTEEESDEEAEPDKAPEE